MTLLRARYTLPDPTGYGSGFCSGDRLVLEFGSRRRTGPKFAARSQGTLLESSRRAGQLRGCEYDFCCPPTGILVRQPD